MNGTRTTMAVHRSLYFSTAAMVTALAGILLLSAAPAAAQCSGNPGEFCVWFDWTTSSSTTSSTTLSWPHTFCPINVSGSNCVSDSDAQLYHNALGVGISLWNPNGGSPPPPPPAVTSVTFQPTTGSHTATTVNLNKENEKDSTDNLKRSEVWSLGPTALDALYDGTITADDAGTITVTVGSAVDMVGGAVSATGVDPTTPFNSANQANTGTTVRTTINFVPTTSLMMDTFAVPSGVSAATSGSPSRSADWNTTAGSVRGGGSHRPGADPSVMDWTLGSSTPWSAVQLEFKPFSSTVVDLEDVTAAAYESGGVLLAWTTGHEVDNLGFRVYREQGDGLRADVTRGLIAGTALLAPSTLQAGHAYSWIDPEGSALSRYYIEDVDIRGRTQLHGPITPELTAGEIPSEVRSRLLEQLDELRSGQVRGVAVVDHRGDAPLDLGMQRVLAASPDAIRIGIREEGWYRIPQPSLVAAGLDPAAIPAGLQLFVDGNEVAIRVTGAGDGAFDPTDAIEFYATGVDTPVTDTRVYWLRASNGLGARIANAPSARVRNQIRAVPQTLEFEQNLVYYAALNNGDEENIFGQLVMTSPTELTLQVPAVDLLNAAPAVLEVALQGVAGDHDVLVAVNGTDVGSLQFSAQERGLATLNLPHGTLVPGANTVRLTPAPADDISLVDSLQVSYSRQTIAVGDEARLSVPNGFDGFRIHGFTTRTIEVADVTNPDAVQMVPTTLIGSRNLNPNGFGPRPTFGVAVGFSTTEPRELYAFNNRVVKTPAWLERNHPSSWYQTSNGADVLIVAHPDLVAAVAPLADYRRSQGYSVAVVEVTDLYDEFAAGTKDPAAIREFVQTTLTSWQQAPGYVLLVGDASYDPRAYLGLPENDLLPTKFVATAEFEAASDVWFADLNGDDVPDAHLGRLPVQNVAELDAIVAKTLQWEQTPRLWNRALMVSDEDDGGAFELSTDQLLGSVPAGTIVDDVRVADVGAQAARGLVLDAISDGPQVVSYVGHGAVQRWAHSILTAADAANLGNDSQPAVFTMMNCMNSYFQSAAQDSLAEALLNAPNKGAVAVWGSTGMTGWAGQEPLMLEFYNRLLADPSVMTLGEAASMAMTAANGDVRRTWVVLGDPLLSLR